MEYSIRGTQGLELRVQYSSWYPGQGAQIRLGVMSVRFARGVAAVRGLGFGDLLFPL